MKRIGMTVGLLVTLSAMSAFGAALTVCSNPGDTTTVSLAGINTNTYTCGDKLFSNFTSSGGVTGSVFIREITTNTYELSFTASGSGFTGPFTFGFDVNVTTPLAFMISQVQAGMLTNVAGGGGSSIPNGSTGSVTLTSGTPNPILLNATSAPAENGLSNTAVTAETIGFSFNPTGTGGQPAGNFLSIDYVISQTTVPEPMTLSLMGVGLLGVGIFGRRRMVKR